MLVLQTAELEAVDDDDAMAMLEAEHAAGRADGEISDFEEDEEGIWAEPKGDEDDDDDEDDDEGGGDDGGEGGDAEGGGEDATAKEEDDADIPGSKILPNGDVVVHDSSKETPEEKKARKAAKKAAKAAAKAAAAGSAEGGAAATAAAVAKGGRPGDWECPRCSALCYASRTSCFKCSAPHPGGMAGLLKDSAAYLLSGKKDGGLAGLAAPGATDGGEEASKRGAKRAAPERAADAGPSVRGAAGFAARADQSCSIFINGLPYTATKADIAAHFAECCAVEVSALHSSSSFEPLRHSFRRI